MAYIIVTIKLLLGLNSVTETQLSSYAREITREAQTNQPLFVWDDWVRFMDKKMIDRKMPSSVEDVSHIQDVSQLLENMSDSFAVNDATRYCSEASRRKAKRSVFNKDLKEDVISQLSHLHNKICANKKQMRDAGSSSQHSPHLPFSSSTIRYITGWF